MKIAVYTIAKNEEQFVERWYESAKDADYLFILDTGSADRTVEKAKSLGINVEVKVINPWRFDRARNEALQCIPDDIDMCIALDMDEVLVEGWRKGLETLPKDVTRPRYKYVWSWNPDGSEGLVYGGDKIHKRHGYIWKHPVHEVITAIEPEVQQWTDVEIHHFPDNSKPRSQYFPLLELAIKEDPEDSRNAFYYARELYFHSMFDKAKEEFIRFLNLETSRWKPERAAALRYLAKCDKPNALKWLVEATTECPDRREGWVELGQLFYEAEYWLGCYDSCLKAIKIKEKPLEYLNEAHAWGPLPFDLLAIACYNMGKYNEAYVYGLAAVEKNDSDERLKKNLEFYTEKVPIELR